ncbi:uncharacterized protein LOC121368391 isoform X2 [Gigantopelta aegis]|uniref:uncharacterized protein LOC121368391 isoform X2 n=1 Tax=Gigantopelta aegis TaxID=1735272 RepID=UPI001B88A863|nr:uncharacterized protein LOC121368391 isoform X2 [Gigantopelta aegis]
MELLQLFSDRWRSQFPGTPPPDLLAELKLEWTVKSRSSADILDTIKRALVDSERKISSLRDHLEKELFIKDLLDNYANGLSKRYNSDANSTENNDERLQSRPVSVTIIAENNFSGGIEKDTDFEQFTAELPDVCASESNNVFAKHRNSLKHVERKTNEYCTPHYEKVWVNGSQSGGDNSSNTKHLTKVNCFKADKSIFQVASDSNKENSGETDASKGYGQVLVIPSSASEPNLLQFSSNGCMKIMDGDSEKDCIRTTHMPIRQGPVVPKKPPKPVPNPRRKLAPASSLDLPAKKSDSGICVKSQSLTKNNPTSQVTNDVSFEATEAGQGNILDTATCANIKSGCGLSSSTQDSKHRDDSLQCGSLISEGPILPSVLGKLVKGVNNLAVIDLICNSKDSKSATSAPPAEPDLNMKKFHRHKSDKRQSNPCDEVQGTYRKISGEFNSCEVVPDNFLEKDKIYRKSNGADTPTITNIESVSLPNEDCVDGYDFFVDLSKHCIEQQNASVDNQQNNTRSSLLDNVSFFKELESESDQGAKNGNLCDDSDQHEVMVRKHSEHIGEDKFLDEDCVDGEFESLNASNEEPFTKKHSRLPSYENWTIDRCVTLPRFDDSNESEAGDDIYDNVSLHYSPPSTLQKYNSYKGSKDSGLCDDLSTSESHSGVEGVQVVTVNRPRHENDIHHPPPMMIVDNLNDSTDSDGSDSNKISDSGSLASDIVFIPASELQHLPSESHHNVSAESQGDQDSLERIRRVSPPLQGGFRGSPHLSSGDDENVSSESCDEVDGVAAESPQGKMLKLRQVLVAGVLDSEESYLEDLELLLTYKRSLLASSRSSQPVIRLEDIEVIFSNIDQLYQVHVEFVTGLKPIVNNAATEQKIGEIFKLLILNLPVYGEYMENYQRAVSKIHRCCEESPRFQEIAQAIKLPSNSKEITNLEHALFKPVQRLQRNTLVLHDLIKYTPDDHPDHEVLKKTLSLSQHNLETFGTGIMSSGALPEDKRYLVKSSFLVELVNGSRKLRYMFLFNDILVCTKKETHRRSNSFICKWFTPLCQITRDTTFDYEDDQKYSWREEIEDMKRKIGNLKSDLRAELKKEGSVKEKHWSIGGMAAARNVEKLKKKIQESEASLILASPKLPVKLSHEKGKFHTLLMTTDYEREEWMEAMTLLCKKCVNTEPPALSAYDVQELVNSVKEQPQVNKLGSVLMQNDEDIFNGTLNVTLHKLNGLDRTCDTYCCLEMDSYDHFFMKARSHICEASSDPSWNEDFELELDGSQTLRILVYERRADESDELLGRGAMELNKSWLNQTFQEKTVVMNEVALVISVRHTPANKTMRRLPSHQKTAVFGVKISSCTRREGKTVPTIVTTCIQEVEKRGLDEVGIYRVSGVTSEVQKLKKMFDKNVRAACNIVGESDIHAVTGVLKLYFRELPEPLFTEANYTNFINALKLADKDTRERLMISLLHDLPAANYYTIVTLLEHLVRVTKYERENKMTTHNLSTVFGPTLLAPAVKDTQLNPMEMMSKGAEAVLQESAVIGFFLNLAASGKSLRKSAQC